MNIQEKLAGMTMEEKQKLFYEYNKENLKNAREHFLPFVHSVNPDFVEGKHHQAIAEYLEAAEKADIKRLMVFMPPRAGKSFVISTYFPAWYIGRNPTKQILAVSYDTLLAKGWGREVRNIVKMKEFEEIFDTTVSTDSRAAGLWHTSKGGIYRAAGIKGGIAGRGANLGIIDDPLNEQDAYSEASRAHVIRWYPGGFRSRLMPNGVVIVLMTRWHKEDLAGHLIDNSKEDWTILNIPAILDKKSSKVLKLPEGGSYWPVEKNPPPGAELTGWSIEELLKTKDAMPLYQWEALYMQNPVIEGGNIIKKDYWQEWDTDNRGYPKCQYVFLSLDTAFSESEQADYSAITTWGVFLDDHGVSNLILLGASKGHWDYLTLKEKTKEKFDFHKPDVILIENKASGQSLIQELLKTGFPVMPYQPDKDKISRAHACTPTFNAGRVWYPKNRVWAEEVMIECADFPSSDNKDYVDATTQAILWVRDNYLVMPPYEVGRDDFADARPNRPKTYWA